MSDGNRWNSLGHWGMGIAAAIVPGLHVRWAQREIDQNPPENADHPVIYAAFVGRQLIDADLDEYVLRQRLRVSDVSEEGCVTISSVAQARKLTYYAAKRVHDSQNDTLEVAKGAEVGRVLAIVLWCGVGFLIGRAIYG